MKLIKAKENYGFWCKKGKYHLINDTLAEYIINKRIAVEIAEISQDEIKLMMADFKINGVPKGLVKYLINNKNLKDD